MKKFIPSMMIILLIAGFALAKEYEVKKKAGDYQFEVAIDRNPPIVGTNTMNIVIKDGSGKAVTDAQVTVNYSMAAMPGMPPMNYNAKAELRGQKYQTALNLSMAGSWNITVKMARGDKSTTVRFTIDAR
jgi:hypothetical protein